jgi:predicted dehydrogenase
MTSKDSSGIDRRNMLKALAGIPVLGALGIQIFRKTAYDDKHNIQEEIARELGVEDLMNVIKPITHQKGDLIRIGIVGFGIRGPQLAKALGFMEKSHFETELANQQERGDKSLETQMQEGQLNVVITGICDVYEKHAENGLATAAYDIHTGGELASKYSVKRFRHYHDMLADPDIDAVIIATPDHHHAQMTIDAIQAGKHVYCEKCLIHREEEIYATYEAVKNSNLVFQQGHQYCQTAAFQVAQEILRRRWLGKISHVETTTNRNSPNGAWIRHLDSEGNPKPGDAQSIDWKQWLGKAPEVPFSIRRFYSWARYFDYDTILFGQLFSHEFDAVNQLLHMGIPETVFSSGGQYTYKEFGDMPDVLHTTFEYPDKDLTLTYSANLTSSKFRGRTLYGRDASMTVGNDLVVTPDGSSEQFADLLERGLIDSGSPMMEMLPGASTASAVDAISSATAQYYAARGLTSTSIGGQSWDVTHLHLKEWLDVIRNGGTPSANIEMAYEEGVVIAMADISYREGCRTKWDKDQKRIVRL